MDAATPATPEPAAPPPAKRQRAPRTDPAERRAQLLDAAEALLADGGSDALRMDAVARSAGVTRPVVYDHFGDRDGLIIALLQRPTARIADHIAAATAAANPSTFADELRIATHAYLEVATQHGPAIRALLAAEHLSPAIETARRAQRGGAAARWAARYRNYTGLTERDAHALAVSHLAGLTALAGLCIRGRLSLTRATNLHVTSTIAALDALDARTEADTPDPKAAR